MTAKKRPAREHHHREEQDDTMPLTETHETHEEAHKERSDAATIGSYVRAKFSALDATGPCPVPEVQAGDILIWLLASDGTVGNTGNPAFFEAIVSVNGELQQKAALAGHSFDAVFLRGLS